MGWVEWDDFERRRKLRYADMPVASEERFVKARLEPKSPTCPNNHERRHRAKLPSRTCCCSCLFCSPMEQVAS